MAVAHAYRTPATDPDAELASLVEPDGLRRALSRHNRRVALGLGCVLIAGFALARTWLAVEDSAARSTFLSSLDESSVLARPPMRLPTWLLPASAPAVPERAFASADTAAEPCVADDPLCAVYQGTARPPGRRID